MIHNNDKDGNKIHEWFRLVGGKESVGSFRSGVTIYMAVCGVYFDFSCEYYFHRKRKNGRRNIDESDRYC